VVSLQRCCDAVASGAYNIGDLCLCLSNSVVKRFSERYSYSFSAILMKLGTHNMCTNTQKKLEQIFEILLLKFLANFLNFKFGQSLEQQQQASLVKCM